MRRLGPKDFVDKHRSAVKRVDKLELRGTGLWTPHVAVYDTARARADLDLPSTWTVERSVRIWYLPHGETWLTGVVKGTFANLATVDGNFGLIFQNIPSAPECGTSGNFADRATFVAASYDVGTAPATFSALPLYIASHPLTAAGTANLRVDEYTGTRNIHLDAVRWMSQDMPLGDSSDWPKHTTDWPD